MKPDLRPIAGSIRSLAAKALADLPPDAPARLLAAQRRRRPVDYMRCAEFPAIAARLDLADGMRVLDLGSPQWFVMHLAATHRAVDFHYVNITESELDRYRPIPRALGLSNLTYHCQDARSLAFREASFDRVVTISVLEHIAPAAEGDRLALAEAIRILADEGRLLLTVPFKETGRVLYADGPVYERDGSGRKFFAREYDSDSFRDLIAGSGFEVEAADYICERKGLLAADYYEWGPGSDSRRVARLIARLRNTSESIFRFSLDGLLAARYLEILPKPEYRVVNISASLRKS